MEKIKTIIKNSPPVLLVIGGLLWGYMALVSFVDPRNRGDWDDILIYNRRHEWIQWSLRILFILITLSALYVLFRYIRDYRLKRRTQKEMKPLS